MSGATVNSVAIRSLSPQVFNKIMHEIKNIKDAIKLAKSEIKEWQKFLKLAEKRLIKAKVSKKL